MPCAVCFLSVGFINQWSRQSRNQMKDIHSGNTHTFYRTLHEPKPRLPWVVQVSWYHWSDKLVIGVRFNWRPYHYLVGGVTWWAWLQRDVTQCCPAPPNSAQTHETAEDTQQWSDVSVLQSDKFHFVFTDSRNKKRCILNRTGLLSGEVPLPQLTRSILCQGSAGQGHICVLGVGAIAGWPVFGPSQLVQWANQEAAVGWGPGRLSEGQISTLAALIMSYSCVSYTRGFSRELEGNSGSLLAL